MLRTFLHSISYLSTMFDISVEPCYIGGMIVTLQVSFFIEVAFVPPVLTRR